MIKRYWNGLDKETNALGIGCWQIAGNHNVNGKPNGWGNISVSEAIEILVCAIDEGIDFFDTAQGYNNGVSEQLLGKAIKLSNNPNVTVCTKIELKQNEISQQKLDNDFSSRVELSLLNLQLETIDILLLHNPPDDLKWNEFDFKELELLVKLGKIKSYGVSSRGLKGALNVAKSGFGNTIEWVYNIFERRPEKELFPLIKEKKMNFIARSPLSRGLINPTYLNQTPSFASSDFRSTLPADWIEWSINSLKQFYKNGVKEKDLVREALTYTLSNMATTACVVGIKSQPQLRELIKLSNEINKDTVFNPNLLSGIEECYPAWR